MKAFLKKKGVHFILNEEVDDFQIINGKSKAVRTNAREIEVEEVILASLTWSSKLARKLSISIPLEAGKGYSFDVNKPTGISNPAVLLEARVALTFMNGFTRLLVLWSYRESMKPYPKIE